MSKTKDNLKKLSENEIAKKITDTQASLKDFRFGIAGSKVRNVRQGRALRRDIARHMTELNARAK
jgi:ribosomal protein L29